MPRPPHIPEIPRGVVLRRYMLLGSRTGFRPPDPALGDLIARATYDNLNRFIVPYIAGPARIVPLAALADKELSLTALRRAAQRGRLYAVQGPDGIYRSSRKAVSVYRADRHQRRGNTAAPDGRATPMSLIARRAGVVPLG